MAFLFLDLDYHPHILSLTFLPLSSYEVGKMFAGIAGARLASTDVPDDVRARLDAMVSKDGEVVPFNEPIDITAQTNVKDWLKSLEDRMHTTLALLLEQAVSEDVFSSGSALNDENKAKFVDWATKFPAQVR